MSACTVSAAFVATPSLRASSLTPFAAPCARRLRTVQPCLGRRSVRHTPRLCTPPPDTAAPAASTAETDVSDSTTTIVASSPPGLAANSAPLDPGVLFGEFISTFLLVLFSILLSSSIPGLPLTPDGLLIAALATAFIPVSGAHFNPAVTLALLATRRVAPARAVAFIALQLIASVLAALLAVSPLLAVPLPLPFPPAPSLAREALAMFWVVAIVFLTAVAPKNEGGAGLALAPVYIGAAVAIAAAALPGTVFNPARMFGPALVNGAWAGTWILWLGPFIGALAAAFMCEHLFLARASKRKPTSWLAWLAERSSGLGDRVKNLGFAGLVSYGIMNTLYYSITLTVMMIRVGGQHAGAAGLAQAWIVTWSLSQVTKPLRLAVSVIMAPFVDKMLKFVKRRKEQQ